ncbi:MAG: pilus assembly protein TadG-related protein [Lachnospiraceae bacterium]
MLKKLWEEEEGAAAIFAALVMVVLLGFTSLAVDYGSMVDQRSRLQNAADAAALAGVVEDSPAEREVRAREYALNNTTGVSVSDIEITHPTEESLKVTIRKLTPAFFSQILTGNSTNQVSATATAEFSKLNRLYGTAIWAEDEIQIGNKGHVVGSIHSNTGNFSKVHDQATIDGERSGEKETMPDYSYLLDQAVSLDSDALNAMRKGRGIEINDEDIENYFTDPNAYYYIPKSVVINTSLIRNIIAYGDIVFNGSRANVDAKILYSVNGNIEFNGREADLKGILYAPKGNVTWNGSKSHIYGAIICQNYNEHGSVAEIIYDGGIIDDLSEPRAHLIE